MRALQYDEYGGPEVLRWAEAPDPHAGAGHVRIAVKAASVNPIDWKAIRGERSGGTQMTGTGYLGYDAAGVVDEVGEGVTGVSVGDEVFGRGRNTQAEYAVLNAWAEKQPSVDWAVAAAAGVAGETAERACDCSASRPARRCSSTAARAASAQSPSRWRSPAGAGDRVRGRGQPRLPARDPRDPGPVRRGRGRPRPRGRRRQGRQGVRRRGQDTDRRADQPRLRAVTRAVSIANFSAGEAGAQVTGGGGDSKPWDAFAEVAQLLEQNKVVVKVQTFPFERAAEAYRISESGHVRGKLVLVP